MSKETRVTTIGDLRRLLEQVKLLGLSDDDVIIMARDEEGNSFSPLAEATYSAAYVAETTWSGYLESADEDEDEDEDDDEPDTTAVKCLVLWPTN